MKKRVNFFWYTIRPLLIPVLWVKFGYRRKIAKNLPETYLVLANHNTDWDPLLVATSFPRQMYFVASEHISRWKHAYKFVKFLCEPILRSKGTVAASTVIEIMRKLRGGENVCIFAEGARSWDGITQPILPSTGKMVKSAKCGLVTYKLEGGYFISPNWSEANTRWGKCSGSVVNVYTAEELAAMSVDEINEIIKRDLHEDAYARQLASPAKYTGKNLAVKMENLLFVCPECGAFDTISSHGDTISCSSCGMHFRYNAYAMLEGITHRTVKELSDWQKSEVNKHIDADIPYTAADAVMSKVENHTETQVAQGPVHMDNISIRCGDTEIMLSEISNLAMHGRHAIVFSTKDAYYEMIVSDKKNAVKFWLRHEALSALELKQ